MAKPFLAADDELITGKFAEIPIYDFNPAITGFG